MSTVQSENVVEVLSRVSGWPAESRLTLARRVLETLEGDLVSRPPKKSVMDLLGLLKVDGPPPSDEECDRIRDEELLSKYGGS